MEIRYAVFHDYEVEGDYGYTDFESELVTIFEDEADAEAFIKKYNNPHEYCDGFYAGELHIEEVSYVSHKDFDVNNRYGLREM